MKEVTAIGSEKNSSFFNPSLLGVMSPTTTFAGSVSSYKQYTQYSKTLGIWRGANGEIYQGLSGRGPNRFTGSRALAKSKAARIGVTSNIFTGVGIAVTYAQYNYDLSLNPGPNLKHYLETRHIRDQSFNATGFLGIYGAATSFGYNLGYLIESVTGRNIQLNPFTYDFTPIEQTLTEFDNAGIYIY